MTGPVPVSETAVSDGVLVHRIAAGSTAALGAFYDRYGRRAFALAAQITGSAELAEDVVFEVFHQLWRDPARYDPSRGGFPSWLLAAAHHVALDGTRQVSASRRCRETLAEPKALILAYFAGRTQQEIAADTRVPLETVRSRIVCGMRQLRVLLAGAADAPDLPEVQP